jgi:uncharacterized protein
MTDSVTVLFSINLFVCLFGTFLSAMSGCGTGILIIPIWLMMGYSLPVGLAVLQLTSILWCPVAARNYLKGEKPDLKLIFSLLSIGLIGTFIGANTITRLDPDSANKLVGILVIAIAIMMNFVDHHKFTTSRGGKKNTVIVNLLALPLGAYEAAFGSGNAIFTSYVLLKFKGISLTHGLGYYYLIATPWCLSSALIYMFYGFSDWGLLIAATIGSVLGGELGSRFGKKRGSNFLKKSMLCAGVVLGLKLLAVS